MRYDPDKHHRRSTRLQGYDYSQQGAYYVTICVHNRECLIGEIIEGAVVLSQVGQAVQEVWGQVLQRFPSVVLDNYVLMPNHLHAVVVFTKPEVHVYVRGPEGAASSAPTGMVDKRDSLYPKVELGRVMRAFKSLIHSGQPFVGSRGTAVLATGLLRSSCP